MAKITKTYYAKRKVKTTSKPKTRKRRIKK